MMAKDKSIEEQLKEITDKTKIRHAIDRFEVDLGSINEKIYDIESEPGGIANLQGKRAENYKNLLADREATKRRIGILENKL